MKDKYIANLRKVIEQDILSSNDFSFEKPSSPLFTSTVNIETALNNNFSDDKPFSDISFEGNNSKYNENNEANDNKHFKLAVKDYDTKLSQAQVVTPQLRYDFAKLEKKEELLNEILKEKDETIETLTKKMADGEEYLVKLESLLRTKERPSTPKKKANIAVTNNKILSETNEEIWEIAKNPRERNELVNECLEQLREKSENKPELQKKLGFIIKSLTE